MKLIALSVLFTVGTLQSQTGPRLRSTDAKDLYPRVAASEYVVTGRITKVEAVSERLSAEERRIRLRAPNSSRTIKFGVLYTIGVEALVCRKTDFLPDAPAAAAGPDQVYIFLPSEKTLPSFDGEPVEMIVPGTPHLLFLTRDPERDDKVARFELEPQRSYYRAVEQDRGAIQLPNTADRGKAGDRVTPFLAATTSLCEAVRPSNIFQKVDKLRLLRTAGDEVMKENAAAALLALTGQEN